MIKCHASVADILMHLLIWLVVIVVTFGVGAFFYPYSFAKFILNRCELHYGDTRLRMHCDLELFSQVGHVLLWILITIITFGIGYLFYMYRVWKLALERVRLEPVGGVSRVPEPS